MRVAIAVLVASLFSTPAFAQAPASAPPQDPHEMTAGDGEFPRLRLSGFGDIDFARQDRATAAKNFSLGQFVLHITSQLSSRGTVFGELSFSARTDAGTGSPAAPGFNVEIERLIVRFDRS